MEQPHEYHVRISFNDLTGSNDESLHTTDRNLAKTVANILQRSKSVKVAYVIERTADGVWVRNW